MATKENQIMEKTTCEENNNSLYHDMDLLKNELKKYDVRFTDAITRNDILEKRFSIPMEKYFIKKKED